MTVQEAALQAEQLKATLVQLITEFEKQTGTHLNVSIDHSKIADCVKVYCFEVTIPEVD